MTTIFECDHSHIILAVKQFLTLEVCPDSWKKLDLYLFRDDETVFYVGQSSLAFDRVWQHIRDGYKGRSVIGRFILCNWPSSMNFTIELMSSQANRFTNVAHNLNAAERQLIEQWSPCFNEALNRHPRPLPKKYTPVGPTLRCSRSLNKLIRGAGYALRAEERQQWLVTDAK